MVCNIACTFELRINFISKRTSMVWTHESLKAQMRKFSYSYTKKQYIAPRTLTEVIANANKGQLMELFARAVRRFSANIFSCLHERLSGMVCLNPSRRSHFCKLKWIMGTSKHLVFRFFYVLKWYLMEGTWTFICTNKMRNVMQRKSIKMENKSQTTQTKLILLNVLRLIFFSNFRCCWKLTLIFGVWSANGVCCNALTISVVLCLWTQLSSD